MARTLEGNELSPKQETRNGHSEEPEQPEKQRRRSSQEEIRTSDREELIQCIKRGQRPTWVPKPSLEALCVETNAEAKGERRWGNSAATAHPNASSTETTTPIGLPDPIPRPPSALHTGDFHTPSQTVGEFPYARRYDVSFDTSPQDLYSATTPPWLADDPYPPYARAVSGISDTFNTTFSGRARSRAPSLGSSLSSSFVMRVPTSPLVHATSSPGIEPFEESISQEHQSVPDKSSRRRTLPSPSLTQMSSMISAPSTPMPTVRREVSAPFRTHQVRRSLTSFTYQPATSSQSVFSSRQRRLSHASETSPRHRSSMIGSFEESILRGRMSTPPSKPLDFVAQIGVLGKGNCPAKLKCPAHVSVPFPAVFYNYPTSSNMRSLSDDSPSPYVGTIDLVTSLKPVEEPIERKQKSETNDPDVLMAQITSPSNTSVGRALAAREKTRANPDETTSPIGGAYRVPQQGQLQVVIKNPNKTAVKLFLIPYDLQGMRPGSKTFVRQRSFSSGPVLEKPLSADPERTIRDPLSEKHILRYLIHLKFCCLAKGKFYLYDTLRVVFANRVPEGKEKLRNEIQLPDPKFSTLVPRQSSSRRQSVSDPIRSPQSQSIIGTYDSYQETPIRSPQEGCDAPRSSTPIPFHLSRSDLQQTNSTAAPMSELEQGQIREVTSRTFSSGSNSRSIRPQSPEVYGFDKASTSQRGSPVPWASLGQSISRTSSPTPPVNGDGLLSRKLREMSRPGLRQIQQNGGPES